MINMMIVMKIAMSAIGLIVYFSKEETMKRRKTLPSQQGYYLFDNGSKPPRYERTVWTVVDVRWDKVRGELCFQKVGSTDRIPVLDTTPREWGTQILIRKKG